MLKKIMFFKSLSECKSRERKRILGRSSRQRKEEGEEESCRTKEIQTTLLSKEDELDGHKQAPLSRQKRLVYIHNPSSLQWLTECCWWLCVTGDCLLLTQLKKFQKTYNTTSSPESKIPELANWGVLCEIMQGIVNCQSTWKAKEGQ